MSVTGRWRIVEMETWEQEDVDLVAPGFIEFTDDATGQFAFIAVRGWMDCRTTERGRRARVEFSWDGDDEGDQVSGRGWAAHADNGTLEGHLYIHMGEGSGFRAVPWTEADAKDAR